LDSFSKSRKKDFYKKCLFDILNRKER